MKKIAEKSDSAGENQSAVNQVFLFCGEDSFSAIEKMRLWKRKFLEKHGEMNLEILEGDKLTAEIFRQVIAAVPFLGEKRLVIVRDFLSEGEDDEKKAVAELLENELPEYLVILFVEEKVPDKRQTLFKRLDKNFSVEWFENKRENELINWVKEKILKVGGKISGENSALIVELGGVNMWILEKEIEKLLSFANGNEITREMIENLLTVSLSSSVFKLTDELGMKRLKSSLSIFKILMESGEEAAAVFYMLVRHFRIMVQVKDLAEKGMRAAEIAREIKEHPFVVSKMMGQVEKFSINEIKRIYEKLAEIDLGFKTGKIRITTGDTVELERRLELLMIEMCR